MDSALDGFDPVHRTLTEGMLLHRVGASVLTQVQKCSDDGLQEIGSACRDIWAPDFDVFGAFAEVFDRLPTGLRVDADFLHRFIQEQAVPLLMNTGCYAFEDDTRPVDAEGDFHVQACAAGAKKLLAALAAYDVHQDPEVWARTRAFLLGRSCWPQKITGPQVVPPLF